MRAVGLIVEYNPFHNGHRFHLDKAKQLTGADVVVAVMSGNYLQRGEMAVVDKWSRTKMALRANVDIVVELPTLNACQSANFFAKSSMNLLNELKCETIVFGSEHGKLQDFLSLANILKDNSDVYNRLVREKIETGLSYPAATGTAISEMLGDCSLDISKPNNALGFQYVSHIVNESLQITPVTFKRVGEGYHDSATSIRESLLKNKKDKTNFMPTFTALELESYVQELGNLHSWELYFPLLKYKIISSTISDLKSIYGISEGIENRLYKFAQESTNYPEFIGKVKTKRYTWTRLQRLCLYILLGVNKSDAENAIDPSYIRVLGFSKRGREYLSLIKKGLGLPLITNASSSDDKNLANQLKYDMIYYQVLDDAFAHRRQFDGPIIF